MQLRITRDTIDNSNTLSYTHHRHLTSTQTLTARINAHPSPVQHLPPPPYHFCNVTLLSRDNGFLRASAFVVDIHAGLRVYWGHILLTCTPPLLSKPASSFYQTAGYDQASQLDRIVRSHRNMPSSKPDVARAYNPSMPARRWSHKTLQVYLHFHVYKTHLGTSCHLYSLAAPRHSRAELQDVLITLQCSASRRAYAPWLSR
jgi:hypothetical protein